MPSAKIILYKGKTLKNGEHPLVLQIYHKKQTRLSMGKSVHPDHWNFTLNEPNSRNPNRKRLLMYLRKQQLKADEVLMDMEEANLPFSLDDFKRRFFSSQQSPLFSEFVERRAEEKRALGKIRTAEGYEYMLGKLEELFPGLMFSEINYQFLDRLENKLRIKGLTNGGISNILRTFKANLNAAIKEGVANYQNHPFANYKVPASGSNHKALNPAELRNLFTVPLGGFQEMSRDMWVCMFLLRGMEAVDLLYLKWTDINGGTITYRRSKTGNTFSIQAHPIVLALFEKYRSARIKIFPLISDKNRYNTEEGYSEYRHSLRRVNRALKKVGEKINLPFILNTKIAKHTFAELMDNFTADSKMLSDMLGHSDPKTSLRYTGRRKEEKMSETVRELMEKLGIG